MIHEMPQAAIIIPHYNDVVRLRRGLEALAPQIARHPVEVVVCDNGSTEDLEPLRRDFPQVAILHAPEKGAGPARNHGVAQTTAPWLFFIDADCVADDDWLDRAMERGGQPRMVGGRVRVFDETPPPRTGAQAFEAVFAFDFKTYIEKKGFSGAGNLLVTRAMFEDVGGFDAAKSEDYDWCMRAAKKGYPVIYAPEMIVWHPSRNDWDALASKWRRMTRESYHLTVDGPVDRLLWLGRAGIVALSWIPHLPKVAMARQLDPADRLKAAGTLMRLRMARMGWMLQALASGGR